MPLFGPLNMAFIQDLSRPHQIKSAFEHLQRGHMSNDFMSQEVEVQQPFVG